MSVKPTLVYQQAMSDIPGVVAANNFLTVYNPVGSGKVMFALQLNVSTYSVGQTSAGNSLRAHRITSAPTGGTLVAASSVARFNTLHPDPVSVVRVNNPSATPVGELLVGIPPIISVGTGQSATSSFAPPSGASFLSLPGQGLVFSTIAGDVDQRWNIDFVWGEA